MIDIVQTKVIHFLFNALFDLGAIRAEVEIKNAIFFSSCVSSYVANLLLVVDVSLLRTQVMCAKK